MTIGKRMWLCVLMALMGLAISGCPKPDPIDTGDGAGAGGGGDQGRFTPSAPLVVDIHPDTSWVNEDETVRFTARVTGGESPYTYAWQEVGGATPTIVSPDTQTTDVHFPHSGECSVSVTVHDADDRSAEDEVQITVEAPVSPPPPDPTHKEFEPVSQVILPAGGTIVIDQPDCKLDGLMISVPEGAYAEQRTFDIRAEAIDDADLPAGSHALTPLIKIDNGGGYADAPIVLTIPVDVPDTGCTTGFYYDESDGGLEGVPTVDPDDGTLQLIVRHFSHMVVITIPEQTDLIESGFQPGTDDWPFRNIGSYTCPEGFCTGAVASALWYYKEQRLADDQPPLREHPAVADSTPGVWQDDGVGIKFASAIHVRQVVPPNKVWEMCPLFAWRQWGRFVGSIRATGRPQMAYLSDGTGNNHVVIVYKVQNGSTKRGLWIVDPNAPGEERFIAYRGLSGFETYHASRTGQSNSPAIDYDRVLYVGESALIDYGLIRQYWDEHVKTGDFGGDEFPETAVKVCYAQECEEVVGEWETSDRFLLMALTGYVDDGVAWRATRLHFYDEKGERVKETTPLSQPRQRLLAVVSSAVNRYDWTGCHWLNLHYEAEDSIIANAAVDDAVVDKGQETALHGSASGGSGSYDFVWTARDGWERSGQDVVIKPSRTTTFTLTVTDDDTGAMATDTVTVTVVTTPPGELAVAAGADPATIQKGQSTALQATVTGGVGPYSFSWSGPGDWTSSERNPTVSPSHTTEYTVAVTDSSSPPLAASGSATVTVVDGSNALPCISDVEVVADLTVGQAGDVSVSCRASDPDGMVASVVVDLSAISESTEETLTRISDDRWEWSGTVTPSSSGAKAVVLTVTDDHGGSATADVVVDVAEASGGGIGWAGVGGGMDDGSVRTLLVADLGGGSVLYAGGRFTSAGGTAASRVARWDGAQWSPLGGGVDGQVNSLVAFDDGSGVALYAGGYFDTAEGRPARCVAKWDGSHWSPVGSGDEIGTSSASIVRALAVFQGDLYAAGLFGHVGDEEAGNIARWDGQRWWPVGGDGLDEDVESMAVWNGRLVVSGFFDRAGELAVEFYAAWDGSTWHALNDEQQHCSGHLGVAEWGGGPALYSGGCLLLPGETLFQRVARWDGLEWTKLGQGITGGVQFVRAFAGYDDGAGSALYVAGFFTNAGGDSVHNIAKWDGTHWTSLGEGLDGSAYTLAVFNDGSGQHLYVGGVFDEADDQPAARIARWGPLSSRSQSE